MSNVVRNVLIAIVVILALFFLFGRASAHNGTPPELTCTEVSANFTSFPEGVHTITFVVTVNGTTTNVDSSFTGTSGTASADISNLTSATGELSLSAHAEWTADGGGQTQTTEKKLVCHEVVTPPVETPTPPTPAPTPVTKVETPEIRGK